MTSVCADSKVLPLSLNLGWCIRELSSTWRRRGVCLCQSKRN